MILWLIGKLSGAAGSAVAAATVSTVLTATTAVPMTVAALDAEPSLASEISSEDIRFPPPVETDGSQLAVGPTAGPSDAGRPADPTVAPVGATPRADEGPTATNDRDDEEFALVPPTPTAGTGSTPEAPGTTPSRPSAADPTPDAGPRDPTPRPTPDTEPGADATPVPATELPRPTPTSEQPPAPAPSPTATVDRPTATVVAPTPPAAPTSTAAPPWLSHF